MNFWKNHRNLYWLILFLFVTNVATVTSILYHKHQYEQRKEKWRKIKGKGWGRNMDNSGERASKLDDMFTHKLDLTAVQREAFVGARIKFYATVDSLLRQTGTCKWEFVSELDKTPADTLLLMSIAKDYGVLHQNMKLEIMRFYFELKEICEPEQHKKLSKLFKKLVKHSPLYEKPERRGKHE